MRPRPLFLLMPGLLLAACSGRLGHVHEEALAGEIPLAAGITGIRVEVEDGTLNLWAAPARALKYRGVCQKRADSEAQLRILQEVVTVVQVEREGDVLVLRLPAVPPGADPMQTVVANQMGIELPADLAVEVVARHRGHLSVQGRQAPVRLESAHGDLRLGDCRGAAELRTAGGTTLVYGHRGDLDVHARSGDIQAWIRDPGESLRLVTGSGNIQCKIPPDRAFHVDARTQKGKVTNGFGLPERTLERFGAAIDGAVGQGGTSILIRTGAGNLSLGVHRD